MNLPFTVNDVLSQHLSGLDNWIDASASSSVPYDNTRMAADLPGFFRDFEMDIQTTILPVQIVQNDDGAITPASGVPKSVEMPHDYYSSGGGPDFLTTQLRRRPVRSIQRMRMMLNQQVILTIPAAWIRPDLRFGVVRIIPYASGATLGISGTGLALLQSTYGGLDHMPQAVAVDYEAGLPDGWDTSFEFSHVKVAARSFCARRILDGISHSLGAGRVSKSISADGLSQQVQYTRFTDLKNELDANHTRFKESWMAQNTPIIFSVL